MTKVVYLSERRQARHEAMTAQAVAAPWIALGAMAFAFGCAMTLLYAEGVAVSMNMGRRQ